MQFKVLGPFEIKPDKNSAIPSSQSSFWDSVEDKHEGLSNGKGCYVFSIRTSGGSTLHPWYVGKTNKQTFCNECFKPHQRAHYWSALDRYKRAKPFIYLIPQITASGRYSQNTAGTVIDFVEKYLIGLALRANDELLNKRDTKLYREIVLPGFLNSGKGNLGAGAADLRKSLDF